MATPVTFPRWFSSFLIELIMCDIATIELKAHTEASLVRVFKAFLQALAEPQTLKVVFTDYYDVARVPDQIQRERPLVMDPANPYLNAAKRMRWEPIRLLALDTLSVLREIDASNDAAATPIDRLFEPRLGDDVPQVFRQCHFQLKFVSSGSWLRVVQVREIAGLGGRHMEQGVIWRATEKLERNASAKTARPMILGMLEDLVLVANMALSFRVRRAVERGQTEVPVVAGFIDSMLFEVFDTPKINWTSTLRKVEDCDVTLVFGQIPILSRPEDLRYVYVSLSFDVDDHRLDYLCHLFSSQINDEDS